MSNEEKIDLLNNKIDRVEKILIFMLKGMNNGQSIRVNQIQLDNIINNTNFVEDTSKKTKFENVDYFDEPIIEVNYKNK